jgi:hypothetical protein
MGRKFWASDRRSRNGVLARLRLAAAIPILVIGSLFIAGSPVALAATPSFGPPVVISGYGEAYAVSCTDAVDCTAVGGPSIGAPYYATETNGTWGSATQISAPGGVSLA